MHPCNSLFHCKQQHTEDKQTILQDRQTVLQDCTEDERFHKTTEDRQTVLPDCTDVRQTISQDCIDDDKCVYKSTEDRQAM